MMGILFKQEPKMMAVPRALVSNWEKHPDEKNGT
jgi:hypothetical protein